MHINKFKFSTIKNSYLFYLNFFLTNNKLFIIIIIFFENIIKIFISIKGFIINSLLATPKHITF